VCKSEPDCLPRLTRCHKVVECPAQRLVASHSVHGLSGCVCLSWHTLGTTGFRYSADGQRLRDVGFFDAEELHKFCRTFYYRDDQVRDCNSVRQYRLKDVKTAPRRAVSGGSLLRLHADDSAVLERTGRALADSQAIGRPPLNFTCDQCGHTLAHVGDTAHGPLFTSTWEIPAPMSQVIVVNGERLRPRAARRFVEQHTDLVEESGKSMATPLAHGVVALLALPADMTQDFPDLVVRCNAHGDAILDRIDVIARLRAVRPNQIDIQSITVTRAVAEDGHLAYRVPREMPGPQQLSTQRETRRFKMDAMPLDEFERRMQERYRGS
jgi:hypothetical protein